MFGRPYGTRDSTVTLIQPYLGFKFDVGPGLKVVGLLSQRWRDGKVDLPGCLYERNVGVAHEDYGRLTVGAMTTRAWSVPTSRTLQAQSDFGGASGSTAAWGASGAGYGLLSQAVRYTSRPVEMLDGDLLLEATYDIGNSGWKRNKPRFLELCAHYNGRPDGRPDGAARRTAALAPGARALRRPDPSPRTTRRSAVRARAWRC